MRVPPEFAANAAGQVKSESHWAEVRQIIDEIQPDTGAKSVVRLLCNSIRLGAEPQEAVSGILPGSSK